MQVQFTLEELERIVKEVWEQYHDRRIWTFYASMGSGKTTFIHALCTHLRTTDHVSSPTFSIVNTYDTELAGEVHHMDWYRLKDEQEAIDAGVEDLLYSGAYCFIEWPEKAASLLPENALRIELNAIDEHTRKLTVHA